MDVAVRSKIVVICTVWSLLIAAVHVDVVSAAGPRPRLAANPPAEQKSSSRIEAPSSPSKANESPATPGTRIRPRTLQEVERLADRLMRESDDVFNRGLMSLPDYADRLSVAVSLNSAISQNSQTDDAWAKSIAKQAALLKDAFQKLETFGQPAAKGWAADVAYARLLSARADVARNPPPKNSEAATNSSRRLQSLAWRQFELRQGDYNVGLAELPDMSRAASQLSLQSGAPAESKGADSEQQLDLMSNYRDRLQNVVSTTKKLSQQGAGLGRDDNLDVANFELARTNGLIAGLQGRKAQASAEFAKADRYAQQAFESQRKYYEKGTASLADLTSTWRQRDDLHQQMQDTGSKSTETARHSENFRSLTRLANQVADRRGRNSADVTMIHGLGALKELSAAPAKPTASVRPQQEVR